VWRVQKERGKGKGQVVRAERKGDKGKTVNSRVEESKVRCRS
jgi:hypothetical protein